MEDALYRQMFEKNRAVQLLIDPGDGAILDANLAAAEFYGYDIEHLKQMRITDINVLPPDEVKAEMERAAAGRRYYFNFPHALASGEIRQVEVHSSPVEVGGRQILYSIVHDITEQRQAEEEVRILNADLEKRVALRTAQLQAANRDLKREIAERKLLEEQVRRQTEVLQSEYERLATVIASVDVSLSVLDPDGTIVLVNDAWLKRTGLRREQVIGVLYKKIERQPGATLIQGLIDRVAETGVPFSERELPIPDERYPDGTLYVDASILPIRNDEGRITALLTVSIDVTERVLARREIESQRTMLESIVENSPIAIAFYDRDLRVVSANSAWEHISGIKREIALGHILYEVSETAEARRPYFERALRGEQVKRENIAGEGRGKGETPYYDITYVPIKGQSSLVEGILAIGVDVTEREQLNRQKDQFIALASHELKSPITVIKGYSQMAVKGATNLGDRPLARRIQTIDEQAQRLNRMVDDLLDVSRMQGGALSLQFSPFDLRDAVRDVVKNLEQLAPNFAFRTILPPSQVTVNADRARIEQVLTNLLQNAVKYSGRSHRVEVALQTERDAAVTSVRDYGLGIPAAQQPQIFDRFFRASNVREAQAGFGLGLFIAHSIVTGHAGRIWLDSTEGKGSTFCFALPLA
jgi:PAS domain S-box-containing protein